LIKSFITVAYHSFVFLSWDDYLYLVRAYVIVDLKTLLKNEKSSVNLVEGNGEL